MKYWLSHLTIVFSSLYFSHGDKQCNVECPMKGEPSVCGFDAAGRIYTMFPSPCALAANNKCYNIGYVETALKYCIKHHNLMLMSRRMYGESCPVFCPSHYRPVCGISNARSYRAFNNGCYLDMVNCRGEFDDLRYVEVPLHFCPRHDMKNIFKEQIMITGLRDYRDYE